MKNQKKTKKQLIDELEVLRNQLVKPKKTEPNRKQAEEALREDKETLRALINAPTDSVLLLDSRGVILDLNKIASERFGKSRDELIGTLADDSLPEDIAKRRRSIISQIFETRREIRFEDERDGIWFDTIAYPVTDPDGAVSRLAIIARDITERKRIEDALRQERKLVSHIMETSPTVITMVDRQGMITFANTQAEKVLGLKKDKITQRVYNSPDWHITDSEGKPFPEDQLPFQQVMRTGKPVFEVCHAIEWPDGRRALLSINGTPLHDESGQIEGVVFAIEDITKRSQTEAQIRESQQRFQALVETIRDWIWEVDQNGLFTYVSPRISDLLGYEPEELLGKRPFDFMPPEETERVRGVFDQLSGNHQPVINVENTLLHKDGRLVTFETSAAPFFDPGGEFKGYRGVDRDITERKQAEAEHLAHLWFFESLDQVNLAMQRTNDLEQMMSDVLAVVLSIYNCDRASLVYPCDPEAASCRAMMEQTRPEYPGALALGLEVPIDPDVVRVFRTLRDSSAPVKFGPGSPHPLPAEVAERFNEQSQLAMAIYPKVDKPWMFVIHQCSFPRIWTPEEERLFQAIGSRLADGLTSLLTYRTLRESEERFRLAFENANTGVCLVDLEGNLTRVNNKMSEIFGYAKEELERMTVNDIAHPEDINKSPEFIQKTLRGETDRGMFEKRYVHKEGHVVTCQVSSSLVRDAEGSPLYFISHVHDITDRKRAEEALRESEERFRKFADEASFEGIVIHDKGKILDVNRQFATMHGYEVSEFLETDTFTAIAPESRDIVLKHIQEGYEKPYEAVALRKDGSTFPMEIHAKKIPFHGKMVRAATIRDVTERKQAEEEMKSLQEQLRQSQKMEAIGRLAGGIAHDFNNLLTVIKGYSQLSLIELKEDTPLRGNIEHIHTATDRAADLVRQLLAFSRRQILEMKVWDLNTILTNLQNMLRRLIGEDIELTTILAEDLGRVKTDLGWIEQAIMNLVVNARDAMPSGGKLTIETRNAVLDEAYVGGHVGVKPGRYVMLSVSDTGVGMTPEVRERLFEPFFSTKEKDKGTGLGLSTVYGIVKQSGGDIWVYSEPGKGSTFKIYLPMVDEPLEQLREKVSADELLRGSETILLVEDEEEVRKLAVRVLERQGYKVLAARDGDEALLICERHQDPIHLMLTDVVMPGMNGHELAERLEPLHPRMKVLYMSGYTDNAIVLHGVLVEGVNYLQKPFTVDALTKKVREVLEQ